MLGDDSTFSEESISYWRHKHLIDCMKALGYPSEDRGLCIGLALTGGNAILLGDVQTFNKRLELIWSFKFPVVLAHQIHAAKENYKKIAKQASELKLSGIAREKFIQKNINPSDMDLIDIEVFLASLEVTVKPYEYPHLFLDQKIVAQDISKTSAILFSKTKNEKTKKLMNFKQFSGSYNEDELLSYFKSLMSLPNTNNTPFYLNLNSSSHAVTIGYDGGRWWYIDAGNLPAKFIEKPKKTTDLSIEEQLKTIVERELGDNGISIFNTKIFSFNTEGYEVNKLMNTWAKSYDFIRIHSLSKQKARDKNTWGSLLHVAALSGDLNIIQKVLNYPFIDLDQEAKPPGETDPGYTPLSIACLYGHKEIVKALLNAGANPNKQVPKIYRDENTSLNAMQTPLEIAQENKHEDIVVIFNNYLSLKKDNMSK